MQSYLRWKEKCAHSPKTAKDAVSAGKDSKNIFIGRHIEDIERLNVKEPFRYKKQLAAYNKMGKIPRI